ncbi:MAG: 6-bladed beta-propeller [candidate division KSB1 bacterium]|nr:6-bladed beta-propeller [candidate division KSB1 bacterium]MDZ7368227.1 6-bladed beta-propeller [candidate division KSB1 bacterium]
MPRISIGILGTALLFINTALHHTACQVKNEGAKSEPLSSTVTLTNLQAKLELVDSIAIQENPENFLGLIATDAVIITKQRMIFVDRISTDLKLYDPKGNFFQRAGKLGSGPGEYRRIMGIAEDSQYVYVHDDVLRRITILRRTDLSYVRSFATPDNVEGNPGTISIFKSRIFISSWDPKYKWDEAYKVQPIAIIDTVGNFVGRLGEYDELYKRLRLSENGVLFDQDTSGNIYLAQYLHYGVAQYSPKGELIRHFGVQGKFRLVSQGLRGNESRDEIVKLSIQRSFVRKLKVSPTGYVFLQYSKNSERFVKTRDIADQKHTLQVYTTDGQYIPSEIALPSGGLLDVDEDGYLYLYLNTEPVHRVIGKYKLNIVQKSS